MKIAIAGAGIAGATAAIALKKAGYEIVLFEATPQLKPLGAGITLAANALRAFKKIGILEEVTARGHLLESFYICDERGKKLSRMQNQPGMQTLAVHRAELHEVLLSYIAPHELALNKRVVSVDDTGNAVCIRFDDGTQEKVSCLLAADGIHSPVRRQLVPDSKPRYAGYTCWRGVVEHDAGLGAEAWEIWGTKGRFGIVPLSRNRTYWFACINAPAHDPQMKYYSVKNLREHFKSFPDPVAHILAHASDESLIHGDITDIVPLSRFAFGNVLLLGDAAHATTPNMGQGACQAIEDAVIIADELAKAVSVKEAFLHFEKRRMKRVHAITNTSFQIGRLAQTENPLGAALRNTAMRIVPDFVNNKQLSKWYEVDF